MSFETTAYLQPYELYLQRVTIEEDIKIGQIKQIDLPVSRFEKIWSVETTVEEPDILSKVQFFSKVIDKSLVIMSSWVSDDHSLESVIVATHIWGIGRREWEGLVTQPFWSYLLTESLWHIEQENYHVAILLSATSVEWFVNKFLDYHLKNDKGWSNNRVEKYLEDFNALPSINTFAKN